MKTPSPRILGAFAILVGLAVAVRADVRLPGFFGDHMVLQREMKIPVWGWAEPGEKVSVYMDDAEAIVATANDGGQWQMKLPPMKAGGPHTIIVSGRNQLTLRDVMIGEVWLCSGQSNMEWTVASSENAAEEIANAKFRLIRHIKIPLKPAALPTDDVKAAWQVCAPETVAGFTAAGYFMARHLHTALDVPIGLINSSWGGTRVEPWTPLEGFAEVEALKEIHQQVSLTLPNNAGFQERLKQHIAAIEKWTEDAKAALAAGTSVPANPGFPGEIQPLTSHQSPTTLFNAMISPLVGYAMRGAIWYQGESNHGEGPLYTEKKKALIGGWRKLWGIGDFPFNFVQIAPFHYGSEDPLVLARFWEAQAAVVPAVPNTAMIVTTDIGDVKDIHPRNKQEVGRRLALVALKNTYGKKDVVAEGPVFKSLAVEGDRLRVSFSNPAGGLKSRDGQPLNWFEIIGEEPEFAKAAATVDGDSVLLSAPGLKHPVAMRFGWHKAAEPNLVNGAGLPAAPFRAGKIPEYDYLALKVEEAANYKLVYDLDLRKLERTPKYDVDNSASITGAFDRIAYFLELRAGDSGTQYAYVAMDAFTDDVKKIGLPTFASGAHFQQKVTGVSVVSNVKGVQAVLGGEANIEFWPDNYRQNNSGKVPGASETSYDFGDEPVPPVDGYGSMQVHNTSAKQTVFAINKWYGGNDADIGIGNSPEGNPDWTFTSAGNRYTTKRLRVLVRMK